MSKPQNGSGAATLRLLLIAGIVALAAGATAYYFHRDMGVALEELRTAKDQDQEMMETLAPEYVRLLAAVNRPKSGESQDDPVTFLGTQFESQGFPRTAFNITRQNPREIGSWREETYVVKLEVGREATSDRKQFLQTLTGIENNHAELRTRSLRLTLDQNDLSAASVDFSAYRRKSSP